MVGPVADPSGVDANCAARASVSELVRQHAFTEGRTYGEDRALAVMAAALADQPGHCLNLSALASQMAQRDPTLPRLKGRMAELLDACPVFVRDPEDPNSVRLDIEALQRSAFVQGQAPSGGPADGLIQRVMQRVMQRVALSQHAGANGIVDPVTAPTEAPELHSCSCAPCSFMCPRVSPPDRDMGDVANLVRQHSFNGGGTSDKDRALAAAAAVLAEQKGHSMAVGLLATAMRLREPGLPAFNRFTRLLLRCPVIKLKPGDTSSVVLDVGELRRSAGVGQAAEGEGCG